MGFVSILLRTADMSEENVSPDIAARREYHARLRLKNKKKALKLWKERLAERPDNALYQKRVDQCEKYIRERETKYGN